MNNDNAANTGNPTGVRADSNADIAPVPRRRDRRATADTPPDSAKASASQPVKSTPDPEPRRNAPPQHAPAKKAPAAKYASAEAARKDRKNVHTSKSRAKEAPHKASPAPRRTRGRSALDPKNFEPFRSNFLTRRDLFAPLACVAAALAIALVLHFTGFRTDTTQPLTDIDTGDLITGSPLRISEVMTANNGCYANADGEFYDWIELENVSESAVSLDNYILTDELSSDKLYPLPAITLQPGECTIVFASGDGISEPGREMHASFKLSSAGETLYLLTDAHHLYDFVEIPELESDTSYAYDFDTAQWSVCLEPTPGVTNDGFYSAKAVEVAENASVIISEIQPSNAATVADEDGDHSDWIEICNTGSEAVNLNGWGLSDSSAHPLKWTFPDISLEPGGYLLIFASDKNRDQDTLHTNFCLSGDGGDVVLANARGEVQSLIEYGEARADASYALENGETTELMVPTPGQANTAENMLAHQRSILSANTTTVMISEVLSSNSSETDENPDSEDYIELYNYGDEDIDLGGMGLSNNPKNPRKWQFPSGAIIGGGEYLVIYCSGSDTADTSRNVYHTNFGVSKSGCTVTLALADGTIVDECAMAQQYCDVAYGRTSVDSGFTFLANATPGAANETTGYNGKLDDVTMSMDGGLYADAITLELNAQDGAQIYYTTDMTDPTTSSTLYTGAISVSQTTIIRAAAYKDGWLSSYVSTQSYFYGLDHQLPVVSLVADPKYLFDWDTGLLVKGPNAFEEEPYGSTGRGANFWMGWEYPANVEYFDESGTSQASDKIGIKIIGQDSRAQDQKGIAMYARSKYGDASIDFNPFSQLDFTSYRALTLRPSGEDAQYTHLRDATLTSLASGTNAMYQAATPVVLYINGECWGVYNLRERINKYYVAQHEGITDKDVIDDIDLIKGNSNVLNGSFADYDEILDFVEEHSLTDEDNLKWVTDRIDIDNYLDYVLCEILIGNTDSGNIKFYHSDDGDVKWKWIFFDLDWAMYTMDINYFQRYLNTEGHGVRNGFNNELIRALLKNDGIKDKFLRRMAELMQGSFATANIIQTIEDYKAEIYYDMQYQFEKWGGSYERWEKYVGRLEDNVSEYAQNALSGVKEFFDLSSAEMSEYFGRITFD